MAQAPAAEQIAAGKIYQRGQQIRAENPGMSAQQVAQLLLRDPVFGQNAISLGQKGAAILQAAVTDPGQAQLQTVGNTLVSRDPASGAITPQFQGLPPEAQLFQWFGQQTPEQQGQILQFMQQRRAANQLMSDREQAIERIKATEAAGQPPSQHDLQLAGYLRQEPVLGPTGNVVGYRTINTYQGIPATGAVPRYPGSPAPSVAPGAGPASAAPGVTPPASGAAPAPGTYNLEPRAVLRRGDTQIMDVPDLSLSGTQLERPAEMALGAGPIPAALGAWGRVLGN